MGYDAILFDLLSALLDSSSLWNSVAGGETNGLRWRRRYLEITARTGAYRPYEELVEQAAEDAGFSKALSGKLVRRWDELEPWPEVNEVLGSLATTHRLAVVTNCSESLARRAISRVGVPFERAVSAERAGWYKPDARSYEMALGELGVSAERTLFVAGSPFDVLGASAVGMSVVWHNRLGLANEQAAAHAIHVCDTLEALPESLDVTHT